MILTSSILLLTALGVVEPYQQFNLNGPSSGYGLNPTLTNSQFNSQPQLPQHFRMQQGNVIQMSNNAQRFYMQPVQPQTQGFSQLQNSFQQNQQRQIPLEIKTQPQPQLQQLSQQQQQQQLSYFVQPPQPSTQMRLPILPPPPPLPPRQSTQPPAPNSLKKDLVSVQPPPDKDFLSSLQIIDNHGNLRNLKDFGLGASGDQPVNPELERSLKSIFETINRDLENAEFLPLAMNGVQNQVRSFFPSKPQSTTRNAQDIQQQHIHVGPRGQSHQIEQQGLQHQQPPQALGYAFQQPKQNQFQFLKPLRANKVEQTPEQPIRSPAQALRNSKQQVNQVKEEQKSIDNLPIQQENIDPPPTKGGREEVQKQQNDFEENTQIIEKAPVLADTKGRRQQPIVQQQPRQEVFNQVQEPTSRQPLNIEAPLSEQKSVQVQAQVQEQQANLGFDDEPVELKAVERTPVQASKSQVSGKQRLNQEQQSRKIRKELPPVAQTVEQTPLNQGRFDEQQQQQQQYDERLQQTKSQLQSPRRPLQQQQYEEENGQSIKSNVKKFEGWTPIVQRPQINEKPKAEPQRQQQQQYFDQQRDDQGFDDQKSVLQEKDSFDQAKQEPEIIKNDFPVQQQEVQAPINQQPMGAKRGGSRLVKLRKSINKFAASAKSKLGGSPDSGSKQFPVEQQNFQQNVQQEKATQQQEQLIFDTLSNFQEPNLEQGQQEQLSQEAPQQPKIQQRPSRPQDQTPYQSPPLSQVNVDSSNSYNRLPRVQAQQQSTKSVGRQISRKVAGPIKVSNQQFEEKINRQPEQQHQEEIQQQQQEEPFQQQRQQEIDQPQIQQQIQVTQQQQDEFSQGELQQQPGPDAISSQQREEQLVQQKQSQRQQQKLDDEPLQQQKQDDFIPQQKQDESSSQQKQGESFSQQKQEEMLPQQNREELPAQQEQEEPIAQQKKEEQSSQQKQDEELSQQKQEEAFPQQPQQKEDVVQEQRVQQEKFSSQAQEQMPQKQSEQQEQQVDEPVQQQPQQQSSQQKDSEDQISSTTTTSTTSRPRQTTKDKRRGQQKIEEKNTGRGKTIKLQKTPTFLAGQKQQQQKIQEGRQVSQQQENEGQNQQQEEVNTQTKIEDEVSTTTSTTTTTPKQISKGLVEEQRTISKGRLLSQKARQQQETGQNEEKQQSIEQDRQEVQIQQQQQQEQQKQQVEDEPAQQQGGQQEEPGLAQIKTQDDIFSATTTTTTTTFRPRLQQTKRLRQDAYQAEKKAPIGQQEKNQREQAQRAQLSAHQLLNTYNPLQFEPERISSLTRASQSSSQDTNVNSSPSAESY